MQTLYACKCGSLDLYLHIPVRINYPKEDVFDREGAPSCGACGYDGHEYQQITVPDDFDIEDDDPAPYLATAKEAFF